ncbi:Periplasmic copper-binding protein (NosD) [uncultured archaeon]|nr:Periplasmic copper-binding protein (NosD) [uncultured archaeon]
MGFSEAQTSCIANSSGLCTVPYDMNADGQNIDSFPLTPLPPAIVCSAIGPFIENEIYTLTSDIVSNNVCFTITADDVTLDCDGHMITAAGNGIDITGQHATIKNCNIVADGFGIFFNGASYGTIENNTASSNGIFGIYLTSSSDNTFTNNNISSTIHIGAYIESSSGNTFISNTISGISRGISLYANSNSNTFISNTISGWDGGIYFNSCGDDWLGCMFSPPGPSGTDNTFYDNLINGTSPVFFEDNYPNIWNTTLHSGTNIMGGDWIGGNCYVTPAGDGFSETCTDSSPLDGVCDSAYNVSEDGTNVDRHPIAVYVNSNSPPTVGIDLPSDGMTLTSRTITVTGTANDTNLDHVNISIYRGGTLVDSGTSSSSPFSVTLVVSSDGAYTITATAYDSENLNAGDSIIVTVSTSIFTPPSSSSSCLPNWQCTNWSECDFLGTQARTCADANACGALTGKPLESKLCGVPEPTVCESSWTCSAYGTCAQDGTQTRICTDTNACTNATNIPNQTMKCFYISSEFIPTAGREKTAAETAQAKIGAANDALDRGDMDAAIALLKEAVNSADEIISTAPTEKNAMITGMLLDAVLNSSSRLIPNGAHAGATEVILMVSDTNNKIVVADSSIASGIVMGVIGQGDALIDNGSVDDGAKVLSSAQATAGRIVSNTLDALDELTLLNFDPAEALGFDVLGVTSSGAYVTESKSAEAGRIIADAIALTDTDMKKKGLSDGEKLTKEALSALPEIRKATVKSATTQTTAQLADSLLAQATTDGAKAAINDIKSKIAADGSVDVQKDLSVFKVTNRETTDKRVDRSLMKIILISPKQLKNLTVIEYVPKSVAPSASGIISAGTQPAILQSDPVISWAFDFTTFDEMKNIYYIVDGSMSDLNTITAAAGEPSTAFILSPPSYIWFNFPARTLALRLGIAVALGIIILFFLNRGRMDKNLIDRIEEEMAKAEEAETEIPFEKIWEEARAPAEETGSKI